MTISLKEFKNRFQKLSDKYALERKTGEVYIFNVTEELKVQLLDSKKFKKKEKIITSKFLNFLDKNF